MDAQDEARVLHLLDQRSPEAVESLERRWLAPVALLERLGEVVAVKLDGRASESGTSIGWPGGEEAVHAVNRVVGRGSPIEAKLPVPAFRCQRCGGYVQEGLRNLHIRRRVHEVPICLRGDVGD